MLGTSKPGCIALRLLAALSILGQSPAYADWWQACTAERQRFCQGVEAGGGRIVRCLDEHVAELSGACKQARVGPGQNPSAGGRAESAEHTAALQSTSAADPGIPAGYHVVYQSSFSAGSAAATTLQGPRAESFTFVPDPAGRGQSVLRVSVQQSDDFSRVANGVPRAEVSFAASARFAPGSTYWITWRMFLPADYAFDLRQPEGIARIHEGPNTGTPPVALTLMGDRYQLDVRNGNAGSDAAINHGDAGTARGDRGRWVRWALRYRPDATGRQSVTELLKDGRIVASMNGQPNAYPGDQMAYFKAGLYKWWWRSRPSDVTSRVLYLGDVTIAVQR